MYMPVITHSRSNTGKTGNQFCATFKFISCIATVSLLIEVYDCSDNSDLTVCDFSI